MCLNILYSEVPYRCMLDSHSFDKYLLSTFYLSDLVVGAEVTAENKKVKFPPLVTCIIASAGRQAINIMCQ